MDGPIVAVCFGPLFTAAGAVGVIGVGVDVDVGAGVLIGSTRGPGATGSSFRLFHMFALSLLLSRHPQHMEGQLLYLSQTRIDRRDPRNFYSRHFAHDALR
jgi:hypothetical protein